MRTSLTLTGLAFSVSFMALASLAYGQAAPPPPPLGVLTTPPPPPAPPPSVIPSLKWGDDKNFFQIYGNIIKGVLVFNDGDLTDTYIAVDNSEVSTTLGVRIRGVLDNGLLIGGNLEGQLTPYSTTSVNQLNIDDFNWSAASLKKAEIFIASPDKGTIFVGEGPMGSSGIAEVDFSRTSSAGASPVQKFGGGPFYRLEDGTLSDIHVLWTFTNLEGDQRMRLRYDTPTFNGFQLSASVGTQVLPIAVGRTIWDIDGRYDNKIGDFHVGAGLSLWSPGEDSTGAIHTILVGSVAALHEPSGLSISLAAGGQNWDDFNRHYAYAKLGYQTHYFDWGLTAFSVDAYWGEFISGRPSTSRAVGAQVVQNIDYLQTELYAGAYMYDYKEDFREGTPFQFQTAYSLLVGANFKF